MSTRSLGGGRRRPQSIGENGVGVGCEARAYSGRDGSPIWKEKSYRGLSWYLWPRAVIADLDANGKPEVILVSRNNEQPSKYELAVLDGRTGVQKWNWVWNPGDYNIWPPLPLDAHGDGQLLICVATSNGPPPGKIFVLNATGKVQQTLDLEWLPQPSTWMALDVNDDSKEELLCIRQGRLEARQLAEQRVVWQSPVGNSWWRNELIRPGQSGASATLVGRVGQTMTGISAATGETRWRCDIPTYDNDQVPAEVMYSEHSELPEIVSHDSQGMTTLVQPAWPTRAEGAFYPPKPAAQKFPSYQPPTRYRPLPWVRNVGALGGPPSKPLALAEWPMVLFAAYVLGRWMLRGQWLRAGAYLFVYLALTLALAAVTMSARGVLLEADEQFSWDGWYWAFWLSAIPLGTLTLVAAVCLTGWKLVRRTYRQRAES